ncbi:MAG: DNA repair protein RadA [Elusimicrobiota bacterium]|nr:DNA repair protein RadA [Elusimicrobiota bacterium]
MKQKSKTFFICNNCGYSSPKWQGRCPECNKWNTFVEETRVLGKAEGVAGAGAQRRLTEFSSEVVKLHEVSTSKVNRLNTNIGEFDRILGGGIMPGSLILLGGPPGIGKSTLMLQVASNLSSNNCVLYVSGEESLQQIKTRADRLGIKRWEKRGEDENNLYLISETNLENIIESVRKVSPEVLIIDSIQTVYRNDLTSAPGSVGQVRECAAELLHLAKGKNICVFVLGHVTKEGDIAGPRVLEHIVDTVLYFEAERYHIYRILRSYKNRFGPTSEIGVFEMKQTGLEEVSNPSLLFLSERRASISGSVVTATVEGTRPLLLEVQALVTKTDFGLPRRMSTGIDYNRTIMLISILENRIGLALSSQDVYVNIVGGIKVREPAIDLPVCIAIYSAFANRPIEEGEVFVGEVGLGGEIRAVSFVEERINEAEKLGFKKMFIPKSNYQRVRRSGKLELVGVEKLQEVIERKSYAKKYEE